MARRKARRNQGEVSSKRQFIASLRPLLALIMVAVATLGATAAFWAAEAEHEVTQLNLQVTIGRMFEVSKWAEYAHEYATWTTLLHQRQDHTSRGKGLARLAEELRGNEVIASRHLDLQAQEEFALGRVFLAFTYFMKHPDAQMSIAESLATDVTSDLRDFGFGDESTQPTAPAVTSPQQPNKPTAEPQGSRDAKSLPPPTVTVWVTPQGDIDGMHQRVLRLAAAVALFVLALVLFTFTDLYSHRPKAAAMLAAGGLVLTIGTAVWIVVFQPSTWPIILTISAIFAVACSLAWWTGLFEATAEEGEALHAEDVDAKTSRIDHLFLRHAGNSISRALIMLIAITVFLSSLIAYWYSDASAQREHNALIALNQQVELIERATQSAVSVTAGVFDSTTRLLMNRARCAAAAQRETLAQANPDRFRAATLKGEKELSCNELKQQEFIKASDFANDFDTGLNPAKYLYMEVPFALGVSPALLYATADGYEALSASWNDRAIVYLSSLTFLAIALYLFGQALAVGHAWQVKTFIGVGALFVVLAFMRAFATWLGIAEAGVQHFASGELPARCAEQSTPGVKADRFAELIALAARHYADAEAFFVRAEALDDASSYKRAADAMECAVAARPLFGRAHVRLAQAYKRMNSAQTGDLYVSLPTRSKVKEVVESQEKAARSFQSQGLTPPSWVSHSGYVRVLLALLTGDKIVLRNGIRVLCAVVDIDKLPAERGTSVCLERSPSPPAKSAKDPVDALNLALALLASDMPEEAQALYKAAIEDLHVASNHDLVFATLTDLEIFHEFCSNLNSPERCKSLNQTIADIKPRLIVGKWDLPPTSSAKLRDIQLRVTASEAGWRGRLDVDNVEDGKRDADRDKLTVVWYAREPKSNSPDQDQWLVWRAMPGLSTSIELSKLERKTDGTVELPQSYFRDNLGCLPAGEYRPEFYLNGSLLRELNLQPVKLGEFTAYRSRELNMAFCQPKGWAALHSESWSPLLVRVFAERQPDKLRAVLATFYAPHDSSEAELKKEYLNRLIRIIKFGGNVSAEVIFDAASKFQGCGLPITEGAIFHKEWVTTEGVVHVALVFGGSSEEQCDILGSIQNYYKPTELSGR